MFYLMQLQGLSYFTASGLKRVTRQQYVAVSGILWMVNIHVTAVIVIRTDGHCHCFTRYGLTGHLHYSNETDRGFVVTFEAPGDCVLCGNVKTIE